MKNKHTEGDWSVDDGTSIVSSTGGTLARCVGARSSLEHSANLHLMAAASSMLAACEDALESVFELPQSEVNGFHFERVRLRIRAAIAAVTETE